ncbi:DUF5709 domain-containing protein [Streptomyces sp. NPDC049916]|uniref:DUF5709 domain-containing protein n=1 Tax=Streptomyces sp. NPDC049916 TaxID=3155156 RepID=UPI00344554D5
MPAEARGDDVYQPQDDDGQEPPNDDLDMQNALGERTLDDQLEEGYSPPERPLAVDKFGTTAAEEQQGESLDQRLAQETADVTPLPGDGIGDLTGGEGEPLERSERDPRAGRLTEAEDPTGKRTDAFAEDVGIDGGAASAEEAAVHIVDEDDAPGLR